MVVFREVSLIGKAIILASLILSILKYNFRNGYSMNYYYENYKPIMGERIKSLRTYYGKKQKDFGNESTISQIEKGIKDINANVLFNIKNSIGMSYENIIFFQVDRFTEDLFFYSFSSILFKEYDKVPKNFYSGQIDFTDKVVQKGCLELAKTFSEFNIQRRNFILSSEKVMDEFDKESDFITLLDGEFYNPARDRKKPINEKTVIDFEKMGNTLWLLLKNKLINSFSNHVCKTLFLEDTEGNLVDFSISNIDKRINLWWESIVVTEIFPQLIQKLKNNPLFNIGFMVDEILNKMVKDDITPSYLSSVPMRFKKNDGCQIMTSSENWLQATGKEREEMKIAYQEVDRFHRQEITLDELHKKFTDKKLRSMGIKIQIQKSKDFIEQVTFEEVLQMVENPSAISPIKNNPEIIQSSPIYDFTKKKLNELPDNLTEEEINMRILETVELFGMPLDSKYVNRKIEGLLQENKAVINYFQEQLNDSLLIMANKLNHIQQAFLTFLSDEELIKWAL